MTWRRIGALLIWWACAVMYFGGFLVAERDAYCCGHGGFIHDPLGTIFLSLGYVTALATIPLTIDWCDK